jgi:hypothetical protein
VRGVMGGVWRNWEARRGVRGSTVRLLSWSAWAVFSGAGCSEFASASDRLVASEVAAVVGPPGQDWSCLTPTGPREPFRVTTDGERVVYTLRFLSFGAAMPLPDTRVRVCALTDLACAAPIGREQTADELGWVDIPYPEGLNGYLEVTSAASVPAIAPLPLEAPDPAEREFPALLPTLVEYGQLALATLGRPLGADEGGVGFRAFDCSWNPALGVSMQLDVPGTAYYFQGGLPNPRALRATTSDGRDTIPPRAMIVRAGWITAGFVKPSRGAPPPAD